MATLAEAKRIVVKIGSALLVERSSGALRQNWLASLAEDIAGFRARGVDVVIVSSGSIALGRSVLGLGTEELTLEQSQAAAAVGQIQLARAYEQHLAPHGVIAAQVLVTLEDSADRRRYLNSRATLAQLLRYGVVPIVNENDTTATAEIKYGDNDRLAARVAQIIGADTLIILSDVDGLYDLSNKKKIIKTVNIIDEKINSLIDNKKNDYGSGGISTKLDAAQICMNSGCHMLLANGNKDYPIKNIVKNKIYTHFTPKISSLDAKKKWIIGSLRASGKVFIDQGAVQALYNGKSLLAAGVIKINGSFNKGENVLIVDHNEKHLARGLASFNSTEINKIKGKHSKEIEKILGYMSKSEVIHKDDMVML